MASSINASTSGAGGVITSADNSGILNIQTAGTTALSIDASQNITTTNKLASASMPTGSVLQVVQATTTTQITTTSTSFVTTGLSVVITPKFSTSKILITAVPNGVYATVGIAVYFTLYRNGSNIDPTGTGYMTQLYSGTGNNTLASLSFTYLNSPASTSAQTYTLYYYVSSGTGTMNTNGGAVSSITVQEIAA